MMPAQLKETTMDPKPSGPWPGSPCPAPRTAVEDLVETLMGRKAESCDSASSRKTPSLRHGGRGRLRVKTARPARCLR